MGLPQISTAPKGSIVSTDDKKEYFPLSVDGDRSDLEEITDLAERYQKPGGDSPRLEYKIYLPESGAIKVHTHLSPTLNYHDTEGLRYGISIDDGPIQVINMHEDESHPQ